MGIHMMGSQGGGDSNYSQLQGPARQNSMYSLTLDEVQNQLGDIGKPLSSMNLDELIKNVLTAEASPSLPMDPEGKAPGNQSYLQRQASLSLSGALSKKTVDEVWRDILQNTNHEENKSKERQLTLGEMTLEDFLVKAGVVVEPSPDKRSANTAVGSGPSVTVQFPPQGQWMQFPPQPQFSHPSQSMMGVYMPAQAFPQPLQMGAGAMMDIPYPDSQLPLHSPLMGTSSDTLTSSRKRVAPEDQIEKSVERRHKRMIKNRESAARSRARKQAYTNELEQKVSRLEEENEKLRKQKVFENTLPIGQRTKLMRRLQRISSAPF